MDFSPRILQIHASDVEHDPSTRRPKIIASNGRDGIVMVYADWCPHCQRFKPWYNRYAERAPEDVLLGVIAHDEVDDIFEVNEVPGFPCFKRVTDGCIQREEVSVNRANEELALRSLRELLETDEHMSLASLERRVHEIETLERSYREVETLRAELAKAAAIEQAYHHQLRALEERLRECEAQTAKKKRATASKTKKSPVKRSSKKRSTKTTSRRR